MVEGSQALIYCDYASGIYIEVSQFSDTGQRDARVNEISGAAGVQSGTWSYGSGDAEGDLWISAADSGTAWRFLTFYAGDRAAVHHLRRVGGALAGPAPRRVVRGRTVLTVLTVLTAVGTPGAEPEAPTAADQRL